jgi:hypothetical protein
MINKWFLPLIFIFHSLLFSQEPNQTLLSDFFNDLKGVWNEIVINGEVILESIIINW